MYFKLEYKDKTLLILVSIYYIINIVNVMLSGISAKFISSIIFTTIILIIYLVIKKHPKMYYIIINDDNVVVKRIFKVIIPFNNIKSVTYDKSDTALFSQNKGVKIKSKDFNSICFNTKNDLEVIEKLNNIIST